MSGRLYDTRAWKRLRAAKLAVNPLCEHCLARGIVEQAVDVDHRTPIARGGAPYDWSNLQSLCHCCHTNKTNAENGRKVNLGCDVNGMPLDQAHEWNGA